MHERIRCSTALLDERTRPGLAAATDAAGEAVAKLHKPLQLRWGCQRLAVRPAVGQPQSPEADRRSIFAAEFASVARVREADPGRSSKKTRHLQKCLELGYLTPYAVGHGRVAAYRVDLAPSICPVSWRSREVSCFAPNSALAAQAR